MEALVKCISKIAASDDQIIVVAPDRQRSECGHSVTQGRPLAITQVRQHWYSVDGTPVDCVRLGLAHLAKDADAVISGVNQGANLGVDVMVSGTVAAAREASLHLPIAIALSHYRHPAIPKTWDHVPGWTSGILKKIVGSNTPKPNRPIQLGRVWNINLPAIDPASLTAGQTPPTAECGMDMNPHQRTPREDADGISLVSDFQNRPRTIGSDVDRCFGGAITVSVLQSDACDGV